MSHPPPPGIQLVHDTTPNLEQLPCEDASNAPPVPNDPTVITPNKSSQSVLSNESEVVITNLPMASSSPESHPQSDPDTSAQSHKSLAVKSFEESFEGKRKKVS